MRLDKILDITQGNLLNTTCISSFECLIFDSKNVKDGVLFFALSNDDIALAIKKGAYGVIFSGECDISDSEIAWIQVDDLENSAFRLSRYLILERDYTFLMLSSLELAFAKSMNVRLQNGKNICIMDRSMKIYGLLEYLFNTDSKNESILSDIRELEKIETLKICSILYMRDMQARNYDFSNNKFIKVMPESSILNMKILSFSIFETRIITESNCYKLNLPYIFLPFWQHAISLFKYFNAEFKNIGSITYDFHNFSSRIFDITFVDSKGKFITNTKSKAIIFCSNPKLFYFTHIQLKDFQNIESIDEKITEIITKSQKDSNIVIEYLRIYAKHLQILACYKKGLNIKKFNKKCVCMPYHSLQYLLQILSKMPYDIALVYGANKSDFGKSILSLQDSIESKKLQNNSLF